MRDIWKLVIVLTLICGISAAALQVARVNLSPVIEKQNDRYIRGPALERLFDTPADQVLGNKLMLTLDGEVYPVFYKKENGKVTALAVEAAGKGGYGGDIRIMIGIDMVSHKLIGLEIIQHSETPGVGARVEKESFRKQWKNAPATGELALQQNGGKIKAITGATYSSKAVMDGTNKILRLVQSRSDEITQIINEK